LAITTVDYSDDKGNSKQTIAVKCFAGCESAAIKKYLRTGQTDYFNNNIVSAPKKKPFAERKIKETYTYTKNGKYVYEVVRWEPKEFSQRRKDRAGNYIWGISDGYYYQTQYGWYTVKEDISKYKKVKHFPKVEPMLYNLDVVKEKLKLNPQAKIFIVGGEKDVNNLAKIGFLAVTNSGGENAKWEPSYTEELKGLNIAFIPDNDLTGYEHLYKVAEALIPVAKSFKVIELPSLTKEHEDFSDWCFKYDGDAEYLKQLYLMADDYKDKPEDIRKDFKYYPIKKEVADTNNQQFMAELTQEMEEIARNKDISKLGLCEDCSGSGYSSVTGEHGLQIFTARKVGDFLEAIKCSCTIEMSGTGLDFN
jgi:hypothetical protein